MRSIISIVEGLGDIKAVPALLTRILQNEGQWSWYAGKAHQAHNLHTLKKGLERFLRHAANEKNCAAILILLDLDDGCPKKEAESLALEIQTFNLPQPVAIAFAHREYEAWFLASLPTIAGHYGLPSDVLYEGDVESKRDAKGWFKQRMLGRKYNPLIHQKKFTSLIDLELAYENSRSFRRLYHAIEQLLAAAEKRERGYVSPLPEEPENK